MVKVRVPATSANIGPGFDCLGVALNIYNTFYVEEINEGLIIEGCNKEFANENNLVYKSIIKCFDEIGYKHKGIKITIKSDIPVSRGLGSSASCILGGIIAANKIAGNCLNTDDILNIATKIEGHPDNIAPALLGGMTVAVLEQEKVYYSKINISKGVRFCSLIPEFTLSTEMSRSVLPNNISFKDGTYNVGRVAMLISAFVNGEFDLFRIAAKDTLHQKYRGELIEGYEDIVAECKRLGSLAVFLSGAGPTIMTVIDENHEDFYLGIQGFMETQNKKWKVKKVDIDYNGAYIFD